MREDTGERVVALSGTGGYAEYATAAGGADLPDPRRRRRRHGAGAADPGPDRVAPVPHVRAGRARRVGGDRRRRGRRGLARRPARQADGRRARDRDGLDAGQARPRARAGRRRRDRLGPRGPQGAPDRGQRRAARSTSSSRWRAAAVFDACLAALAPFGRLVTYGIASGEGNEVHTRKLMGRSRAIVGFWLMHCLGPPGDGRRGARRPLRARGARRAARGGRRDLPALRRRARPRSTWRSAARRARSCSTRAADPLTPRKLHRK